MLDRQIEKMSKSDLAGFLAGYIKALSMAEESTPEMDEFVLLQKKIISELLRQRVYKVSTVDATDASHEGVKETDVRYFSSLNAAKAELRGRYRKMMKNPTVAAPVEIRDIGLSEGVCPELCRSAVSNHDVPLDAPGRCKFFEVRTVQEDRIVPIQYVLTAIEVKPAPIPTDPRQRKNQLN